jgi:hypothetical protein
MNQNDGGLGTLGATGKTDIGQVEPHALDLQEPAGWRMFSLYPCNAQRCHRDKHAEDYGNRHDGSRK